MMDNFKEDIVSPRSNALGNVLYALCWVFIVLFGAYALMMLQVVMVQFSVLTLVTVAMAAACAVLLFFIKDQLKVEYEYTFTNGSLDFAKVFRQAKRKELGSMNVKNVSACGQLRDGFRRYLSMKDIERRTGSATATAICSISIMSRKTRNT
ncbi:MAG: hypothetical protein ACLS7Z_08360 [Christensenellales bacterium]